MKIALYTSNRTTIPPQSDIVAATATLTSFLADGLVEKGHDVTLYAAKGSQSKAKIVDLNLGPARLDYSLQGDEWVKNMNLGMKQIYLGALYKDAEKYDIIHLQTEPVYLGMPFATMTNTPTVYTNHNVFITQEKPIFDYYIKQPIISISNYQRTVHPHLNYVDTVYNGIDASKYPYYGGDKVKDYMYFIGRLVKVKGVAEAIELAQVLHKKLLLAGKGTDQFIAETITPHISETIKFLGHIPRETEEWFKLYGEARVYLAPIQWEEPFGMVLIESMACGTPVVAYARGAVPEVVEDGKTGFIVNFSDEDKRGDYIIKKTGIEGMCEAIERIYAMGKEEYEEMRKNCREHVQQKFTITAMVDNYIKAYEKVIQLK